MPERSRKKRPTDISQLAAQIVAEATNQDIAKLKQAVDDGKNPAAVALGRMGGLKGGRARAES